MQEDREEQQITDHSSKHGGTNKAAKIRGGDKVTETEGGKTCGQRQG